METMMELLLNAENVRMLMLMMLGYCGYVKLGTSLGKRIDALDRKIDDRTNGLEASICQLKTNDFAHLNAAIEALTFTLEKNNFLKREDKEYIDGRLDR